MGIVRTKYFLTYIRPIRHGWYSQTAILVAFWSMTPKVLAGLISKRTTICSNFPLTEDIEEVKRLTSFHQPGWLNWLEAVVNKELRHFPTTSWRL